MAWLSRDVISLIPPDEMNSLDQCFAHMVSPFALVSTMASIYVRLEDAT